MDIISIGFKDIMDILLVGGLLYYVFQLMRQSGSLPAFVGIMVFIVVWLLVSQVFEMRLLGSIFDKLVSVGVLALIILFQDEIRRFLYTIGAQRSSSIFRMFFRKEHTENRTNQTILALVMSAMNMGKQRIGALIVIERNSSLDDITHTGEDIDAIISQRLIENIFFKNSPLHDGAMVISNDRIKAAGCILPIAHQGTQISKRLGLRHRAAVGISQESDALAIAVSEETGRIAVAVHGQLLTNLSAQQLEAKLTEELIKEEYDFTMESHQAE